MKETNRAILILIDRPRGVQVDVLKKAHESQPRNERIANVLYRRGIIESVGTGTQEMVKESIAIGKPEPEYIERGNTFVVCFKKQSAFNLPTAVLDEMSDRQYRVFLLLKKYSPLKSSEIIEALGLNVTECTLRRDLNGRMDLELIDLRREGQSVVWFLKDKAEN